MKIKGFQGPVSWAHASFRFLIVRHHRSFKTLTGFVTLLVTEATSPSLIIKSFARNTPWVKVMQEGQVLEPQEWKLKVKGWTDFVNQIMCANLYFGKIFHLQKSAGLMVSPFPHSSEISSTKIYPVLLPLFTCNAINLHSQQEDNRNTPTCKGILTLPVLHTPHLDL